MSKFALRPVPSLPGKPCVVIFSTENFFGSDSHTQSNDISLQLRWCCTHADKIILLAQCTYLWRVERYLLWVCLWMINSSIRAWRALLCLHILQHPGHQCRLCDTKHKYSVVRVADATLLFWRRNTEQHLPWSFDCVHDSCAARLESEPSLSSQLALSLQKIIHHQDEKIEMSPGNTHFHSCCGMCPDGSNYGSFLSWSLHMHWCDGIWSYISSRGDFVTDWLNDWLSPAAAVDQFPTKRTRWKAIALGPSKAQTKTFVNPSSWWFSLKSYQTQAMITRAQADTVRDSRVW